METAVERDTAAEEALALALALALAVALAKMIFISISVFRYQEALGWNDIHTREPFLG